MVAARVLTDLEQVLLAMICTVPCSGYELKQRLSTTPMGVYKPSSGSLYPALRRLERRGLIRAQRSRARRATARPIRVYEPTAMGRAAHLAWVRAPLDPASISPQLGMHLLRFVMMEPLVDRHETLAFLRSFEQAMAAFVDRLERSAAGSERLGRHAVLALDHGVAVHRASLEWARRTIAHLDAVASPPIKPERRQRLNGRQQHSKP
jgi:DNA-binding PadR family transcriptional regulator